MSYSSRMCAGRPRFSIITVTYNATGCLDGTSRSLVQQVNRRDFEWLVKDGNSTDETAERARAAGADQVLICEDAGIYDAMNQAVCAARGDWLYFLNAGDEFVDDRVVADVASVVQSNPDVDLLFGDVRYFGARGERQRRFHWMTRRRLIFGDLCHQAVFVHRRLFDVHGSFDSSLRWNADFDWLLRVFRGGARTVYLERDIARFHDAGAHVQAGKAFKLERDLVQRKHIARPFWVLGNICLRIEHRWRRILGQSI